MIRAHENPIGFLHHLICNCAKFPGHLASFGFGPKALFLLLGSVAAEENVANAAEKATEEDVEPASKRPRTDTVEVRCEQWFFGEGGICLKKGWGKHQGTPCKKLRAQIDGFRVGNLDFTSYIQHRAKGCQMVSFQGVNSSSLRV